MYSINFNQSDANVLYKVYILTFINQTITKSTINKCSLHQTRLKILKRNWLSLLFFGACNIWNTKSDIKALHTDSQRRIQIHLIGGSQVTLPSSGFCANSPLMKMSIDTIYYINIYISIIFIILASSNTSKTSWTHHESSTSIYNIDLGLWYILSCF